MCQMQSEQITDMNSLSLESTKLLHSSLLPAMSYDTGERDDLHGCLFQRIPAVVPCGPNDAIVITMFTCILWFVNATYKTRKHPVQSEPQMTFLVPFFKINFITFLLFIFLLLIHVFELKTATKECGACSSQVVLPMQYLPFKCAA